MTLNEHWELLRLVFLPTLLLASLAAALSTCLGWLPRREWPCAADVAWVFACALVGATSGLVLGASRSPAVSAVLPALLTIVTTLCGYAFTKESLKPVRGILPFCVIALLTASLYGTFMGTKILQKARDYETELKKRFLLYENVELPVRKEQELRKVRAEPVPLRSQN